MEFRIADSFTDSLARLTGEEQKAAKTTAFDLQVDPANPGMSFHKLDRAKDKNFWSVRVNADLRIIVHRTQGSLLLCYVGHHDRAYDWAERRKLETHPKTGAAQLVEIREKVREIVVPVYVPGEQPADVTAAPAAGEGPTTTPPVGPAPKPLLFGDVPDEDLLGYGVPPDWLEDVKEADEDSLLVLADHLPAEAAEALLELATGGTPRVPTLEETAATSPFDHPDAQRRFRVMSNVEELERALDSPWDRWTIFLHPDQRDLVERDYSGPARVSGSAGTGKTVVALHRAVHLARTHPDARVLLATFSDTLARALHIKLRRLIGDEPRLGERIDVYSLDALSHRLYKAHRGERTLVTRDELHTIIEEAAAAEPDDGLSLSFLRAEWDHVVDAWQLDSWEAYRDVARLGRRTRLPEARRGVLWAIFERVHAALRKRSLMTQAGVYAELSDALSASSSSPYEFAVIDEAQDLSVAQLRFLATFGVDRPNALFFAGDLGQRIFQQPFSWKSLGVEIRGRSHILHVNYRTSHQIRQQTDRLLDPEIVDVDGEVEDRRHTVSVFNGPLPEIRVLGDEEAEVAKVGEWLADQVGAGVARNEIGVFVRSPTELTRAQAAFEAAGIPFKILDEQVDTTSGYSSIGTMHLAKGLEFRAVAVMACDDEVIPLQDRIEAVGDDAELHEVYDTERQLLYVACTRARDVLLISGVDPASEFLDDLRSPL